MIENAKRIDQLCAKNSLLVKNIDFSAYRLNPGRYELPCFPTEVFVVVLCGELSIRFGSSGESFSVGHRCDVFSGLPEGFYLSPGDIALIESLNESEIAFCQSNSKPTRGDLESFVVKKDQVVSHSRGENGSQRAVYDLLTEQDGSEYLLVGETISRPGMWSSYPPHKHDQNSDLETKLEEIYYYRLENDHSFGYQSIYSKQHDRDDVYRVFNHDVIHIPYGYHPVTAPPDSSLYYLWVLSGESKQLKFKTDEAFL